VNSDDDLKLRNTHNYMVIMIYDYNHLKKIIINVSCMYFIVPGN